MEAKEKARELIEKFLPVACGSINQDVFDDYDKVHGLNKGDKKSFSKVHEHSTFYHAKQCAIILVKERLKELETTHIGYGKLVMQGYQKYKKEYWANVLKELESL